MSNTQPRNRVVLRVEALEARETPSTAPASPGPVTLSESFDQTHVGTLPSGWSESSTGNGFIVSSLRAQSGAHGLSTADQQNQSARAWLNTLMPADMQASASIFANSMVPALVIARGTGLDTDTPSYYAIHIERGIYAQLLRVDHGAVTVLRTITSQGYVSNEWVSVTLSVTGDQIKAQIYRPGAKQYLNASGGWQAAPTWVLQTTDGTISGKGMAGVGRARSYDGALSFDDFSVTHDPASSGSGSGSGSGAGISIPQHYPNIRIAELAYSGMTIGAFEDQLLKSSVDLVVSYIDALGDHIKSVAPNTPQLAYANMSSLYLSLLTDWLTYADSHGIPREAAFYHVAHALPFSGDSGSSQPVNWFWGVYRGGDSIDFTDLTTAAHAPSQSIKFGAEGEGIYVGYPDKFREINLSLTLGAHDGWSSVLEYPTAVDAFGNPTDWSPLPTIADSTAGLARSGRVTFDPPADWQTAITSVGTPRLYYVRFRTVNDGTAPVASTILGRDYVGAHGTSHGIIPSFDYAADKNHDGYLSDAEYAKRAPGNDARFAYESRAFYGFYGQERFATNPAAPAFRSWAVDFSLRYLNSHPQAKGLFMDNSGGNSFLNSTDVLEPTASYSNDYGALLASIDRAIAPRWILANTSGGSGTYADGVVRQNPAYFEEFALRPLAQSWQQFEDFASTFAHRKGLRSPSPYAVLDALPLNGSPTDPRTQITTLAEYYMVADPNTTFLDPFGGFEPATSWTRHWIPAVTYDIGRPTGEWSLYATGADPSSRSLTYRIYERTYGKALVLFKPLSYAQGAPRAGTLVEGSATYQILGGVYKALRADGTLGPALTGISLRNGEGAILIKVDSAPAGKPTSVTPPRK